MKLGALFVTAVPMFAVGFLAVRFAQPPWTGLRVAGLVLAVFGAVALTVARIQLGDSFSVSPQARELVTRGLYARIRNPVYVFSAILIAGGLLYLDQLRWFWIFLVLIPLQIMRARAEARVLEDRFGDSYRQYRAQTWF
jgi:protein-S-isoprenylcysteine O-methyltransferase Ste14